jgi:Leucine-rich repeat (LRR) protein
MDMSHQNISHIGDTHQLENICKKIQDLYLSNNKISDWEEVRYICKLGNNII